MLNPRDFRTRLFVLLPLVVLKMSFNPFPLSDIKTDGGAYYYQVARYVADGDGLVTSVSNFHNGLKQLPDTVTFYPLWPLVRHG